MLQRCMIREHLTAGTLDVGPPPSTRLHYGIQLAIMSRVPLLRVSERLAKVTNRALNPILHLRE